MRTHIAVLSAIALATVTGGIFTSTDAHARKGGSSQGFELLQSSKTMPGHGYSGKLGIGSKTVHCDYQRLPVHDCSSGRCKVVSWTLKHHCY